MIRNIAYRIPRTDWLFCTRYTVRGTSIVFCLLSIVCCLLTEPAQSAERIVSLNACTDELLLQLAEPAQIVGVTRFEHSPLSDTILKKHSEIIKVTADIERIIQLNPTIILAEPFSNRPLLNQLLRRRIPIVMLDIPRNWDELIQITKKILGIVGNSKKIDVLEKEILALKKIAQHSRWKNKKAVFWSVAGHISGRKTFENTIIETLGMQNAVDFEGYAFMSLEKLIALKPQVILVTQQPSQKDSWGHETLFHPSLKAALPDLEYLPLPESAVNCASAYTIQALKDVLKKASVVRSIHF